MDFDSIQQWWGYHHIDLTMTQMGIRAFVSFLAAIVLLRISGRRSFGMKSPFDNTFVILLGSILAKAVIGDVRYSHALVACLVLAVTHRIFAYISLYNGRFGGWIKGDKILLYKEGKLYPKNMRRSLVSENDLHERIRINGCESLEDVKIAYMERNGEISIIKKS